MVITAPTGRERLSEQVPSSMSDGLRRVWIGVGPEQCFDTAGVGHCHFLTVRPTALHPPLSAHGCRQPPKLMLRTPLLRASYFAQVT